MPETDKDEFMIKVIKKTTWMWNGILLALACGAPASADDTELLLLNPNADIEVVPNVMLIIDSSTSMETEEETREVYDHTQVYSGAGTPCDPNYLYWSQYKTFIPSCDPANTQRILKSSFLCESGTRQLQGIGSYRNTMAQHRDGSSGFVSSDIGVDAVRWQKLEPGNETDIVECRKDAGLHGNGVDTSALWPMAGGDNPAFTSDPARAVSWGSWPTSTSVTVFDGNYLNYLESPVLVTKSRIGIVQDTATAILNSIEGINVAIMRFNDSDGGPVIKAMQDLDTNRDDILATIRSIPSDGQTPVSETLFETALYWRGVPAYYGERIDEIPTDPAALIIPDPEVYRQPETQACAKNFNVLLTDGEPNDDEETPSLVDSLPNWGTTLGYSGCTGDNEGDCLDDIAAYLFNDDIDASDPGVQTVTTHTIAFAEELPILEETAQRGGGSHFLADDVTSLSLALLEIVNDIQDRSVSFAAPAVAVNSFNRTLNLNDVYLTTFAAREQFQWPGNLKKYRIAGGAIVDANSVPAVDPDSGLFVDSAQSFWSSIADGNDVTAGGAVENMPDPSARNLFTNQTADPDLTAPANALSPSNISAFAPSDFGLTGATNEPTIEQLIRWARGEDVTDVDLDPTTTVRKFMGDPLHSQPAAIVYGGTSDNPDVIVFTATNDGYMHAVNGATGQELWAFIPKEHLPNLQGLYVNPEAPFKNYGIDGDIVPVVADRDNDGIIDAGDGDFVYIMFGMRRGGNAYYLLDVTNRNRPVVKWRVSLPEFGQTWSRPTVARVDIDDAGQNNDKAVVILGGGYDTVHDTISHPASADAQGNGIFFLDLETGNVLWRAGPDVDANLQLSDMTRAMPSQIRVVDMNGDTFADRMYASDMGGQIWRFDIFGGNAPDGTGSEALVAGGVVARLGAEGLASPTDADTRRFYTSPDVSIFNDSVQNRRFIAISIGSGYRAHPLDNTTQDRFYSIRDSKVFTQMSQIEYDALTPIGDADLVEVSGQVGTLITQNDNGWRFTLPDNQKILSTSVTFDNEVFFVAFSPDSTGAAQCSAGIGRNFLYRVDVRNGDPVIFQQAIVPGEEDLARVTDLAQGGIAPSPAFLFPSPDPGCTGEDCTLPPLGCVGVECFDPGFDNLPVRTLWTQDGVE
jgi:type IV pilus assembly protein PilY1